LSPRFASSKLRQQFMLRQRRKPLPSHSQYALHLLKNVTVAALLIAAALMIGVLGYHFIEGLSWIDSLLNASMILGGMGPVNTIQSNAGKLFASFYALFSGLVFIGIAALLIAAPARRFLHRFHLETDEDDEKDEQNEKPIASTKQT
jgi:hypothetical protein